MTRRGMAKGERHWTAWGDRDLAPAFVRTLAADLGPGTAPRDWSFAELIASLPPSRLPAHAGMQTGPEDRARHARGRSLADLIDLRGGLASVFPDGVAYPQDDDAVRDVIAWARGVGAQIVPFGGGTSVVGHLLPDGGATLLPQIRAHCQGELGWDDQRQVREEARYLALRQAAHGVPDLLTTPNLPKA